ncbi:hypothetical protein K443DRAFT_12904 [Laccaria amethystina LaAM-08-1]|uniref:Uncharacterized protein n=1 Tax=Laccaria amethystina LaAM-08-1 TaxID=1095629 RepID=A0A0C9WX21_9AGAR|nr:hypothetical protein K443DRAFT_12904 [Laccaria amethystina LaAM-08-1]
MSTGPDKLSTANSTSDTPMLFDTGTILFGTTPNILPIPPPSRVSSTAPLHPFTPPFLAINTTAPLVQLARSSISISTGNFNIPLRTCTYPLSSSCKTVNIHAALKHHAWLSLVTSPSKNPVQYRPTDAVNSL